MNLFDPDDLYGRGDGPAQAILDRNARSYAQRVADQTKEELDIVKRRVEKTLEGYELTSNVSKQTSVEYVNDIIELEKILADDLSRRKYQNQVTVFIVGFSNACGERYTIMTQLNQFFVETSHLFDDDDLHSRSPEIDFDETAKQIEDSLQTAADLGKKLSELNQDMIAFVATNSGGKKDKNRRKVEKALAQSKEDLAKLTEQLARAQRDLEDKESKLNMFMKQLDVKTAEAGRLKAALDQSKKAPSDATAPDLLAEKDRMISDLQKRVDAIGLNEAQLNVSHERTRDSLKFDEIRAKILTLEKQLQDTSKTTDDVKQELVEEHQRQMLEMENLHRKEMDEMRTRHQGEVTKLKDGSFKEVVQYWDQVAGSTVLSDNKSTSLQVPSSKEATSDPENKTKNSTNNKGKKVKGRPKKDLSPNRSKPGTRQTQGTKKSNMTDAKGGKQPSNAESKPTRQATVPAIEVQRPLVIKTEFSDTFPLEAEEEWATVPLEECQGRFAQFRVLAMNKIKEVGQADITKYMERFNIMKQQFTEHKQEWEMERLVLIEAVGMDLNWEQERARLVEAAENEQKLREQAEERANEAMDQLEQMMAENRDVETRSRKSQGSARSQSERRAKSGSSKSDPLADDAKAGSDRAKSRLTVGSSHSRAAPQSPSTTPPRGASRGSRTQAQPEPESTPSQSPSRASERRVSFLDAMIQNPVAGSNRSKTFLSDMYAAKRAARMIRRSPEMPKVPMSPEARSVVIMRKSPVWKFPENVEVEIDTGKLLFHVTDTESFEALKSYMENELGFLLLETRMRIVSDAGRRASYVSSLASPIPQQLAKSRTLSMSSKDEELPGRMSALTVSTTHRSAGLRPISVLKSPAFEREEEPFEDRAAVPESRRSSSHPGDERFERNGVRVVSTHRSPLPPIARQRSKGSQNSAVSIREEVPLDAKAIGRRSVSIVSAPIHDKSPEPVFKRSESFHSELLHLNSVNSTHTLNAKTSVTINELSFQENERMSLRDSDIPLQEAVQEGRRPAPSDAAQDAVGQADRRRSSIVSAYSVALSPMPRSVILRDKATSAMEKYEPPASVSSKSVMANDMQMTLTEHPIVLEYLKVYELIVEFKNVLSRMFSDKEFVSASQILSEISYTLFEVDAAKVTPQIVNMTVSVDHILNEILSVLTGVVSPNRGYGVSSYSPEATSRGPTLRDQSVSAASFSLGVGRSPSTKSLSQPSPVRATPKRELPDDYEILRRKLEIEKRNHLDQQRRKDAEAVEMGRKIATLTQELAYQRTIHPEKSMPPRDVPPSRSMLQQESPTIWFTSLDMERNAKTLKRAMNEGKVTPQLYDKVVTQMQEYVHIPAERFVQLVQKYVHHRSMKEVEDHLRQNATVSKEVYNVLRKMESVQAVRAVRWAALMDEWRERRFQLAETLTETMTSLEEESGLFLIKPVCSFNRFLSDKDRYKFPVSDSYKPPIRALVTLRAPPPSQPMTTTPIHESRGLMNSSQSMFTLRKHPTADWSAMAASDFGNPNNELFRGQIFTEVPRLLELDINRSLIANQQISASIKPFWSSDRIVNMSNAGLRSYFSVLRPNGNLAKQPDSAVPPLTAFSNPLPPIDDTAK